MQISRVFLSGIFRSTTALVLFLLAPVVLAQATVDGIVQVSKKRVGRTTYEYTYQIVVSNPGDALNGVTATVTSPNPNTVIVDDTVDVGDLAAGASGEITTDTFSFRQNRRVRFNPASLQWTVVHEPTGTLLPGPMDSLARDAVADFDSFEPVPEEEISYDAEGNRLLRTILDISLDDAATVGDVNELLQSINAEIVSMADNVRWVTIRIPDPGTPAGLNTLVTLLESDPLLDGVLIAVGTREDVLPPPYDSLDPNDPIVLQDIDHQLAIRASAAWNAQKAIKSAPALILYDSFSSGQPQSSAFRVNVPVPGDFAPEKCLVLDPEEDSRHGYSVLSVIAGDSDGAERVAGLFPGTIDTFRAVCLVPGGGLGVNLRRIFNAIIEINTPVTRPIILNTSVGQNCSTGFLDGALFGYFEDTCRKGAQAYIEVIQDFGLEDFFLHVASAGNDNGQSGINNSYWNAATLRDDLLSSDGSPLTNLSNVLIVENRGNSGAMPPVPNDTLSPGSSIDGDISAIGTDIEVITGPDGGTQDDPDGINGTSFSAPQVSALAAYVWSINPDLTIAEVKEIIKKTAQPQLSGADVVDAYEAVLAVDRQDSGILTPSSAPVRKAILDVTEDGKFDEADVEAFLAVYQTAAAVVPDYSRFDLNGDSFTGGSGVQLFNLDGDFSPTGPLFTRLEANINGKMVEFDEQNMTDLGILCFYAYGNALYGTSIFEGDANQIAGLLATYTQSCNGDLIGANVRINDTASGWNNLPADITLRDLDPPSAIYLGTTSSPCFGEIGGPVWSSFVDPGATFYRVTNVQGMPYTTIFPNRFPPCSAFIATINLGTPQGKVWINAAARGQRITVFGISDIEYQARYFGTDPAAVSPTETLEVGDSFNFGNYFKGFDASSFSVELIYAPP